jgi:NTE family protein
MTVPALAQALPPTSVQQPPQEHAGRPRVGLVLGGGGARGAAHIGVLEVLQELRVPVDCIAGTSMGALVTGVFAAGQSPAAMGQALAQANWDAMFQDNPDFYDMSYRNKRLSQVYVPGSELGVTDKGLEYAPGVISGQKIKAFFNELVRDDRGERQIQNLPIPIALIATDILTGDRVVMREGSLSQAMRASMSVPGLMAPVERDGTKLVDGGLVDNVPIDVVRQLCKPDIVIAVNVGSPLLKADQIKSLVSVSAQMVNILTEQNVKQSLALLTPADIYIQPDLTGISAGDFKKSATTTQRGREAALKVADRLEKLAVGEAQYASWQARIDAPVPPPVRVDAIEIVGLEHVNPADVSRLITQEPGQPLDTAALNADLLRVYGEGFFESVDYSLLRERDRNILRVTPIEKAWGPDYLRFGIALLTDRSTGSTYALRAAYHKTWVNPLGAELLATAQIGNSMGAGLDFYQPLDAGQAYFLETAVSVRRDFLWLFQNDNKVAEYSIIESNAAVSLGARIGTLGQARIGYRQTYKRGDLSIGSPVLPEYSINFGGVFAAIDLDRNDRIYQPRNGWAAQGSYFVADGKGYSKLVAELRGATQIGADWVVQARASYQGSPTGELPIYDVADLGGFLNLSAFARKQLLGDNATYAGLRIERILGEMPLGMRGDMRLGLALEIGKFGRLYTETQRTGWQNSVGIYFGGETPIGPVFVGYAYSPSSGYANAYLLVGVP